MSYVVWTTNSGVRGVSRLPRATSSSVPRSGNRTGVAEKANPTAAQCWWRTLSDDLTVERAQQRLDEFCRVRGDTRLPPTANGRATVVTVAASEQLTEPQRTRMQARGGCFADPAPQGVFSSTLDFRLTPVAGAKDSRLFSTAGLRNGFRRGHGAHNVARNAPPPRQALHHECEDGVLLYM